MDLDKAKEVVSTRIGRVGGAALSALFPRDFDYYMVALELTDFDGNTIEFFSFPIMPSQITKTENTKTSVYPTLGGTTVINSDVFVPQELTLSGDFGRSFKLMIGRVRNELVSVKGVSFSNITGVYHSDEVNSPFKKKIMDFLPIIKSGYGCTKILQSIISRSTGHDNGKPFRLYFYNLALGETYLVVPTKSPLILAQTEAKNMIWSYTLNLTIVAPLDRIDFGGLNKRKSMAMLLTIAIMQFAVNKIAQRVTKYVKGVIVKKGESIKDKIGVASL
jgi:hypothetical protein